MGKVFGATTCSGWNDDPSDRCTNELPRPPVPLLTQFRCGARIVQRFRGRVRTERPTALVRSSPSGIEPEMREYLMPKLGQMRIAAMAGIRSCVDDLGLDVRGALAQHDDPAGEKQRLFDIMGHQERGEA
jgi:hypothetical protein